MDTGGSRRERLCDAAIEIIASAGLRGMTHRAVDRAAGVPQGSTSYYFRTRLALLTAVARRLAEADLADLPGPAGLTAARAADRRGGTDGGGHDLDHLADLVAGFVTHAVGPARTRMLARYEVSLAAGRQEELRAGLTAAGSGLRALATRLLAAAGAPEPERQGRDLVACVDGLVYDQLAGSGGPRAAADVRATLREVLRGMVGR